MLRMPAKSWTARAAACLIAAAGSSAEAAPPVFPIADAQQVAMGVSFGCMLKGDTSVWCWGANLQGQAGNGLAGTVELVARPSLVTSGASFIAAGANHACAVVSGGVQCWGTNTNGQLGNGSLLNSPVPVQALPAGSGVEEVRAGTQHTCARSGGTVQCWGSNTSGQLGNGATLPGPSAVSLPVAVTGLSNATSLAAGGTHTCAVTSGGGALCWGANRFGQLGDNSTSNLGISTPTSVNSLASGVEELSAGAQHTCARTSGGAALCWGDNGAGQLGDASFTQRLVPTQVSGLTSGVTSIAALQASSCAATATGASCWGRGTEAQLGISFTLSVNVPNAVASLGAGIAALSGSAAAVCARMQDQSVQCWGDNFGGALSRYYLAPRLRPTPVGGAWGSQTAAIAMGQSHACALKAGGAVECSGNNAAGQLGDGTTTNSMVPVPVQGISGATAVATGWLHSCAITAGGGVQCWGRNSDGQLGNGSNQFSSLPVDVTGLADVVAITAGAFHTCAATGAGAVSCWGRNVEGQLGTGATSPGANTPQPVGTLAAGVASVHAGNFHTCALRTAAAGGQAFCWGLNGNGQVGNGTTTTPVTTPFQVTMSAQRAVAGGGFHTCAADGATGAVSCWGANNAGQLGDNTNTQSPIPIPNGVMNATSLALGDQSSCARIDDGGVSCWGQNLRGQLGRNNIVTSLVPVAALGLDDAIELSARLASVCATRTGGAVSCWGWNPWGQFGDGSRQASYVPSAALQADPAILFADNFDSLSPGP